MPRGARATDPYVLIYDGECRICLRSIRWIQERERAGRIRTLPYQDPEVAREYSWISRDELEGAMQLISPDGVRWEGAEAVEQVLGLIPYWRGLAPLFRVPGVRVVARWVYGWVARNRRRFGCGEHCGLPEN